MSTSKISEQKTHKKNYVKKKKNEAFFQKIKSLIKMSTLS